MKIRFWTLNLLTSAGLISCGGNAGDTASPLSDANAPRVLSTLDQATALVPSIRIQQGISERTIKLTIASPSFPAPVNVEVILPGGYNEDLSRR
ncbi:hypothetical protein ACL58G_29325 [Massilia sp. GER05]|uniref:hypothetical protein n=1 Tax=Massilia sp. GER05 TaxID=3394605 RepID=UPI003F84F2E6